MKKIIQITIILFLSISSQAQNNNWTLEDCIRYARVHRNEIKKSTAQDKFNRKAKKYANFEMLPSLGLNVNHNLSWGNSLNPTEYKWEDSEKQNGSIRLFSEMLLFNGLGIYYNRKEKNFIEKREQINKEKLKYDIGLEVIKNYFETCVSKERIEMHKLFIRSSNKRLDKIRILVNAGKLSELDILEIQAQIEKESSNLYKSENSYNNALYGLKKSINLSKTDVISLANTTLISNQQQYKTDSIYNKITDIIPDRYLLQKDSLILKAQINQVRSMYYPKISLQAELNSRYQKDAIDPTSPINNYKYQNQIDDNFYKQISLNISIPIYNRHKVKAELSKVKLKQEQLKIDKANFYEQLYLNTDNLCSRLRQLRKNCSALKKQSEYYNKIVDIRTTQYEKGKLSIIDLLTVIKKNNTTTINKKIENFNLKYLESLVEYYTTSIN